MNESKTKVMGTILSGSLKKKESWYRPMFFCTKGKDYQISGFVLFDANSQEVVASLNQGWINNTCKEIPFMELERKSDISLAAKKPYFIPCKDKSNTALDGKCTYTIYVPIGNLAEMGEQRIVETEFPNMGILVQDMAKATVFGQDTEICLSSEMKYYQSFQKRKGICEKTGISDLELKKVLEEIMANGYSVNELLEDK